MLRRILSLSALAAFLTAAAPAMAEDVLDSGDTSWMIVATVLVIMMTIPGLALFYGGLVRTKNMLSVLMLWRSRAHQEYAVSADAGVRHFRPDVDSVGALRL